MKPLNSFFYTICFLMIWLFVGQTHSWAQNHDVDVHFRNNAIARCTVNAGSDMYSGDIDKKLLRFKRLLAGEDGQLTFQVQDFENTDNILFRFINESTTTNTYGLKLSSGIITIDDVDGQQVLGSYNNGDTFKIVRCSNAIVYFHNDNVLNFHELTDNNFAIISEINVTSADASNIIVQFNSL